MTAKPAKASQNGRGLWLYKQPLRHRIQISSPSATTILLISTELPASHWHASQAERDCRFPAAEHLFPCRHLARKRANFWANFHGMMQMPSSQGSSCRVMHAARWWWPQQVSRVSGDWIGHITRHAIGSDTVSSLIELEAALACYGVWNLSKIILLTSILFTPF